jgi:hypothetical protein
MFRSGRRLLSPAMVAERMVERAGFTVATI